MKTYTLTITETDTTTALEMTTNGYPSREVARVDIPPVAEPLKLLVKLLQCVDAAETPKKPRKPRSDAGKSRTNGTGVPA